MKTYYWGLVLYLTLYPLILIIMNIVLPYPNTPFWTSVIRSLVFEAITIYFILLIYITAKFVKSIKVSK